MLDLVPLLIWELYKVIRWEGNRTGDYRSEIYHGLNDGAFQSTADMPSITRDVQYGERYSAIMPDKKRKKTSFRYSLIISAEKLEEMKI